MKSEHRHELETNQLSAGLARTIQNLKPYSGQMITGLVLLALVYVGISIWNVQAAQREQAAWDAFALASDTTDREMASLQRVAGDEQYAGTKMSEWAYVGWADRQVLNAMDYYLVDREKAESLLQNVAGIYQGFASSASDAQVRNRARFGLARVYELQNKIDEASQQYLNVQGDLQPLAAERAAELQTDTVRQACAWLATAELPKRDQTGGQGASGARPQFGADLPAATSSKDGISQEKLEALLSELEDGSKPESDAPSKDDPSKDEAAQESTATE
jgi:hypothetical protein